MCEEVETVSEILEAIGFMCVVTVVFVGLGVWSGVVEITVNKK